MREIRTLLPLELLSLYGFNKFRHTKDKKEKNRYKMLFVVWLFLIGMVFAYVGALVYALCQLGLSAIAPAYLTVIASLLILMFGIFSAGHRIFAPKGYDILASLPVKPSAIVISRFLSLYLEDLVLALVIMLPGTAVYGFCCRPGFLYYLFSLLSTVCIPAIPLVISTAIGTLITSISSRMKSKSLVQTILSVLLVVGVLTVSFRMESAASNFSPEAFAALVQHIGDLLGRIYLPAIWMGNAMLHGSVGNLALFTFVSLATAVLTVWIVAKCYRRVQQHLHSFAASHDYKISTLESRSLHKALLVREAKRYFSSSIYVTNTIIGPILGAVMAVSIWVVGLDTVQTALPGIDLSCLLPFAFAAVFCMMTTSSTAISMEGKHFWVIKSLPIPTKAWLDSKILLNLLLMLPFYAISAVALALAAKPDFLQLIWLLLIPAVIIVFSVVFGITVNLKLHSFDWDKEETIVKQSASAALGGFSGLLIAFLLGVLVFLTPAPYADAVKAVICLVLLALTMLLYQKNNATVLTAL